MDITDCLEVFYFSVFPKYTTLLLNITSAL